MRSTFLVLEILIVIGVLLGAAIAGDLKPITIEHTDNVTVSLLSETGQWKPGTNEFVVTFTKDGRSVDAGVVGINTSIVMPGMGPLVAGGTLQPDVEPGRYRGTISFPCGGDRQVTVDWDGPRGKVSTSFTVPVR